MVSHRAKLPADEEKVCTKCLNTFKRRPKQTPSKFKKQKTCGAVWCRAASRGVHIVKVTVWQNGEAMVEEKPPLPKPLPPPPVEEVTWTVTPDFSKYNVREKPSALFQALPPPTFLFSSKD